MLVEKNNNPFSSIDPIGQCLVDEERTTAFQKAIAQVVNNDTAVLDLGTGSGIMALSAAKSDAKEITAVEFDPYVASIAENNFTANGYKINLQIEDARNIIFPTGAHFDVVVSEMLTTGIVDEYQVQAINNLHDQGVVDGSTVFIPKQHQTLISLVNVNFNFFGLNIPMILHLWKWHKWDSLNMKKISGHVLFQDLDFNKKIPEKFEKNMEIEILESGVINAIHLTSLSVLTDTISVGDTEALNAPMIIPFEKKEVSKGEKVNLNISYTFGEGYNNFHASLS